MLLGHRSGIPEWDRPAIDEQVARHPAKVWRIVRDPRSRGRQAAAVRTRNGYSYSNTDYNLLGLIIERATGRSWRHEMTRRVIRPLRLTRTPCRPRDTARSRAPHAHGYVELDGRMVDMTRVDPSMAGAAGGTRWSPPSSDLARFLDALLKGRLFRHRATLQADARPRPDAGEGGLVGYGLGVEQHTLPGGIELIGHLGGAAVYRTFVGRLRPHGATIAFALNVEDDPSPLILPVVNTLAATQR